MQKKLTFTLILLYLLPWGIQCIISNFMPVYVASLPFATEKTVGEVAALGAIVTMVSQMIWTKIADKSKNKSNILALSLILLAAFSMLFLIKGITKPILFAFVILFYSCYMTHQPLIDTITSENCGNTTHSFGWFRSFASLGYALVGLLLTVLPNDKPERFFIYSAILAIFSAVTSKLIPAKNVSGKKISEHNEKIYNKRFVSFLILTFMLYFCSSITVTFFPVYYTAKDGIGGNVGVYSFMISVATFLEWGIMIVFAKILEKTKAIYKFFILAISGIFRNGIIFLVENQYLILFSFLFQGIWYGLLWSSVTPYIKKIVPEKGLASAQGTWTVVSAGLATFAGSYFGGIIAEAIGLKLLFMVVSVILIIVAGLSTVLIKNE